jgi:hypothetical protein
MERDPVRLLAVCQAAAVPPLALASWADVEAMAQRRPSAARWLSDPDCDGVPAGAPWI